VAETQNGFTGIIRRIDFEPKYYDFLQFRTWAHVFLEDRPGGAESVDVYTDDPRFEAALLAMFEPSAAEPPKLEVRWEEHESGVKTIVRVIMDREFAPG
jgi:hypothetical protein